MRHTGQVTFTRPGWGRYLIMNRGLGSRFIKGFILRHELAAYLAAHEASGAPLDTECQEIHYGDGIYLLVRKCQGVWHITDIWAEEASDGFSPVYLWQRIKRGWQVVLAKVLVCWRHVRHGQRQCLADQGKEEAICRTVS